MSWDVWGHEWAESLLKKHIAGKMTRHAYLFTGAPVPLPGNAGVLALEAGARLGEGVHVQRSCLRGIAQAHGVSSAQVIIRWHLQAGNICIPGSSNEQHIIEDYDVWDFELTEEEMAQMTALERDDRFADY